MIALALLLALQDPGAVLDRASAAYDSTRTLSADFVQIVVNPLVGTPDTTRGTLYQERPSHFEMRFTSPAHDRVVADGRWLWVYTPSTTPKQVFRLPIPAVGTTGPNLIGQFVDHPRDRYTARYLRADSTAEGVSDLIDLVPRAPNQPYSEAVVWVGRADGLVRRVDITESSNQRRSVILSHLVVNAALPASEFTFAPPAGVRVVAP
ncbi:MAG TPA: outer membrane lipoprotein chaperone LolA [Gemmatimonadales bacterium]|nr:outer membrane lipoprotein chaperone LolA [Gemmatimonadales bacterium]